MDANGMSFGIKLAFSVIGLSIFGFAYNWAVEHIQKRNPYVTAELVALGVLATVLVSALLIGIDNALVVVVLFAASGFPMLVGSWVRIAHDNEEAKREMTK